jgi:hypothetical protein
MYTGKWPYGLEAHVAQYGKALNGYRGDDFAQPRALERGDILAGGLRLIKNPVDGNAGSVGLELEDPYGYRRRALVAARLPLQLGYDNNGLLPGELQVGHTLKTGDVVLAKPQTIDNEQIELELSGGYVVQRVPAPVSLRLAVMSNVYPPPDANTPLGAYVLRTVERLPEEARVNLAQTD